MADKIKVALKVRPLIRREIDANARVEWTVTDNKIAEISSGTETSFGNFLAFFLNLNILTQI